jgi:hypothetical protein
MLNPLRRRPPPPRPAADDGYLACYGIVVACASLLLLVILAATVSIGKACALAGAVAAAFGLMGCLYRWCADDDFVRLSPACPPARRKPTYGTLFSTDLSGGAISQAGARKFPMIFSVLFTSSSRPSPNKAMVVTHVARSMLG